MLKVVESYEEYINAKGKYDQYVIMPQNSENIFGTKTYIVDNRNLIITAKQMNKYCNKASFDEFNTNICDNVSKVVPYQKDQTEGYLLTPELYLQLYEILINEKQITTVHLFVLENIYRRIVKTFTLAAKKKRNKIQTEALAIAKNIDISAVMTDGDIEKFLKGKRGKLAKEIKFSILITMHNNEGNVDNLIEAIKEIDYSAKKFEVLILDDGSSDQTAKIKQKLKQLPMRTKYYYQENQGVGVARNKLIKKAKHNYLLFIDGDDSFSKNILYDAACAINNLPQLKIIQVPIYENGQKITAHSRERLTTYYRFNELSLIKKENYLSNVAGTFISKKFIEQLFIENLAFFEDTNFINNYVLTNQITSYAYLNKVKYNYSKTTINSLSDVKYQTADQLVQILSSYAKLLTRNKQRNQAVDLVVLKSLRWILSDAYNREQTYSPVEQTAINQQLAQLCSFINANKLLDLLPGEVDILKKMVMLNDEQMQIYDAYPLVGKTVIYFITNKQAQIENCLVNPINIWGTNQYYDCKCWVATDQVEQFIKINALNKRDVQVTWEQAKQKIPYEQATALFMDRIFQAGDNAQYLYEYVQTNKRFKEAYFVISKRSEEWETLEQHGYKLIEYASAEYIQLLKEVDYIFSSHVDKYIINYANIRQEYQNQIFVFLQHGIINNDLKNWLFDKKIDYIVSSFDFETKLISEYFFTEQIIESGLARFDLLKKANNQKKYVTYFTSWSSKLANMSAEQLKTSGLYERVKAFVTSENLKKICLEHQLNLRLKVHPMLEQVMKNDHSLDEYISTESYGELIANTAIGLTDFSSVIFDLLYTADELYFYNSKYSEYFCEKKIVKSLDYDNFIIKRINDLEEINYIDQESPVSLKLNCRENLLVQLANK